ncbi:MAG: energy transducer TonB [Gemmatimonadota bacterium]|nr:energy transducer TonB [Gemmatimonadota bacterium]
MTNERRTEGDSWPDDLVRLDHELRGLVVDERDSFGEELRARLVDEHRHGHRGGAGFWSVVPRRRHLVAAAAAVAVLTVSLSVPPVRASWARLLGFPAAGAPEPAPIAPERTTPPISAMDETVQWEGTASLTVPRPSQGLGESPDVVLPLPATLPRLANPDEAQRIVADEYPQLLQRAGIGGTVGVLVLVEPDGSPNFPQVVASSDVRQLDMAALRATRGLRFEPATRGGRPVGIWVEFSIMFRPETEEPPRGSRSQETPLPRSN